jgi:hypothetical protein
MKRRKIENDKFYRVMKSTTRKTCDYGTMLGSDVKLIVKYFTYDKELTSFEPEGTIIYSRNATVILVEER